APCRQPEAGDHPTAFAVPVYPLWPASSISGIRSLRLDDPPQLATERKNWPSRLSTRALRESCDRKPPRLQNRPARIAPAPVPSALSPDSDAFVDTASESGESAEDRKSTRLNSSHVSISYAVF